MEKMDLNVYNVFHIIAQEEDASSRVDTILNENPGLLPQKDMCGNSLLHAAAFFGRETLVANLISRGLDNLDVTDVFGNTPLHMAARRGYMGIVKLLIESKASITVANSTDETPFHEALKNGHLPVVEFLLHLNPTYVDTPTSDAEKVKLLHCAASKGGYGDSIEFLCRQNPSFLNLLDVKNHMGESTLFMAASSKNKGCAIETLLRLGSKLLNERHAIQFNMTPLDAAYLSGRRANIDMLRALGAESGITSLAGEQKPLDEDFMAEVRHRVYFCHSLVGLLLLWIF